MKHYFRQIQGWAKYPEGFLLEYENFIKQCKGNEVIVEVGSWKGRSAVFMGVLLHNYFKEHNKAPKFFAVDHFKGSDEKAHHEDPICNKGLLFAEFQNNIYQVQKFVTPIKAPSVEAAQTFEDNSIDFLLIDGGHTYEDVYSDIKAWITKMKPGSIICGDDANWSGVRQAAEEWFNKEKIQILGEGKSKYFKVVVEE